MTIRQALCCVCGSIRECRRPRNYQRENYWLFKPVDRNWHRETGDLKCVECGRVTRHALVFGGDIDHAENIHKVATGWSLGYGSPESIARVQQLWREGTPQNPYLNHRWFTRTENEARAAGRTHFQALCMARVPVPTLTVEQRGTANFSNDPITPREFHDVDREDPETGLWWFDQDCVDCLSRANAILSDRRRDELKARLMVIVARISDLDLDTVSSLLDQFDAAADQAGGAQG